MTRAWGDGISKWWYLGHATLWIISGIICYFDHKNGPHAAEARRHLVRSLWIGFVTWTFFIIFTTVPYESAPPGNTVTSATTTKVTPGPTTVPEYGSAGQGAVRVAEPKTPVVSRMPEPPDPCSEISTADQARELLRYIDTYDGCLVIYGEVGFGFGDSFYLRVGGDDFLTSESIDVCGAARQHQQYHRMVGTATVTGAAYLMATKSPCMVRLGKSHGQIFMARNGRSPQLLRTA